MLVRGSLLFVFFADSGDSPRRYVRNLVPRVYSAFKMAAERRGSSLGRHLESGVDPGNEVGTYVLYCTHRVGK